MTHFPLVLDPTSPFYLAESADYKSLLEQANWKLKLNSLRRLKEVVDAEVAQRHARYAGISDALLLYLHFRLDRPDVAAEIKQRMKEGEYGEIPPWDLDEDDEDSLRRMAR